MATKEEYVGRAAARIMRLLDEHHALVNPEVQARISEGSFPGEPDNIDPHHVTTALRELNRSGRIIWDNSTGRSGQDVATIQPADQHRRGTKIEQAASRKRLLMARYLGWANPTRRHPQGLIGPAGETAVRASLTRSGQLQAIKPEFAPVDQLLGVSLNGPVDSAGFLVPVTDDGLPGSPVTILIEVKNIRSWIYPWSTELYQVLDKASGLQAARPDQQILPVLICRKAHKTAFWMASQLGFMIVDTDIQFAGNVDADALLEVRNELHFQDLHAGSGPSARVTDRFGRIVPRNAARLAGHWKTTCSDPAKVDLLHALRYETHQLEREELMQQLRDSDSWRGGW